MDNGTTVSTTFLYEEIKKLDIELSEVQCNQFIQYYNLLIEWNSFMNLTGITEYEDVVLKHFVDSLSLVKAVDLHEPFSVIDVGTGAGFPGIPLKIAFPQLEITLLDSLQKRINFLDEVISSLGLEKINTIHGRAEDLAKPDKLREKYDLCVSRAVANLSTLSEYCLPFVKVGGCFVSYKSEKLSQELDAAKKAVFILGGKVEKQVDFMLSNEDYYRNLVVIRKKEKTPKQYPRKSGVPSKSPIG